MAEKALVRYQVDVAGDKMVAEEIVEAKKQITTGRHPVVESLISVHGNGKRLYVHDANLVCIVIEET